MSLVRGVQRGGSGGGGGASAFNDLTDVTLTSPTSGDLLEYSGSAWVNISRMVGNVNLQAANGTLVVPISAGESNAARTAKLQTALNTWGNASNNSRPDLYIPGPAVYNLTEGVGFSATDGARKTNGVIRMHPDAIITKDASVWPSSGLDGFDNSALGFSFWDGLTIIGGQIDGAQSVTPGVVANFNAGSAGDGIRIFSSSRVRILDTKFRNCADSWLRVTPRTDDTNVADHDYLYIDNVDVVSCNQFSTTNTSGLLKGIDYTIMVNSRFRLMNSNKWASRAGGTTYLYHANNVYKDVLSPVEWDGLSGIISKYNRYEGATQRAGQIISNNSLIDAGDFAFSHIIIDDEIINCASGFFIKPDNQADQLRFPCKNVYAKLRMEGAITDTNGFGFDIEGDFVNATFHLVAPDWGQGTPMRYAPRGDGHRNNVDLIFDVQADQTGATARNFLRFDGSNLTRGRYGLDGVAVDFKRSKAKNMLRGIAITGISMTAGTASGATTNAAGYAIGAVSITLASAGTGTIKTGEVVSFAGDSATYRTTSNDGDVSNGGSFGIDAPGLLVGIPTSATAITVHATIGTAASSTTNNAGYAVGATAITLAATGTGHVSAGDSIRFANDPNSYTVLTGCKDVSAGGGIVLAAPGLRVAIPTSNTAITIEARHFLNDWEIKGSLEGGFSSGLLFMDTVQRSKDVKITDFKYRGNAGGGLAIAVTDGGVIDGNDIDCASTPLDIASSCAGVRLGRDNVIKTAGVPSAPTSSQGPIMASTSRSTATITVTITHGRGSDFTIGNAASCARMFEYVRTSTGAITRASSVTRTTATTFDVVLLADPGGAGTLICYDASDGYRDVAFLPLDNSGFSSPLRAGAIAVT